MTDYSEAACRDADPELFFATLADGATKVAEAKTICHRCPIENDCLNDALDAEGAAAGRWRWAVLGGLDGRQRARRKRPHARVLALCGTAQAGRRHRQRGEPLDEACRLALNEYSTGRKRAVAAAS